jgi:superfamily II DNA or RNA helicase
MEITPANGHNPRDLYEHQAEAIKALNDIDKKPEFRTMLVLPTGGGKTLTAVNWLLKNAVDKGKKILWIAHRQLLLEQAAETFSLNAYTDDMINHTVFNYRLVSGVHDKPVNIKLDDNVIIAGKDSIVRSLEKLDKWLNDEDIYFVIDEAHHAVARSYKKIIDYVDKHAKSVKLLGLTATPFRTSEDEKGALKKIFTDDIIYKVDLQELIDKRILAYPYYEEVETKLDYSEQLGIKALQSIENFDKIPEDIAKKIGGDSERNALIVKNYLDHYEKYGQTIVFTVSKDHAVALNKLFNEKGKKYGIKSGFVVSDIRDEATGITISNKDNEKVIEEYSNGNIQVLINVNILTEGTDLPQTHTVFLARPTVSRVLMTQMVGRALRGEKAKGTKEAYIVSFIDNWHDKIAWVNPKILSDEEYFEKEDIHNSRDTQVRWISISKLEEFAMMADANVDTSRLDSIPMIERIPLGMYLLKMDDATYTILIYSSNKEAYSNLIADLKNSDFTTEFTEDSMNEMIDMCMEKYFSEDMIPECKRSDIEHLIKYFSERPFEPLFILLDELDRKKLDASDVAKYIYENDLSRKSEREYIDKLWNEDGSVVPVYFSNQYFFKKMIEIELDKLNGYIKVSNVEPQSQSEIIEARKLSLYELIQRFPKTGIELREKVYNKAKNAAGQYVCACCKKVFDTRQFLHVDHIVPMSKGGLTEEDNLQVLCRTCNMQKGDK